MASGVEELLLRISGESGGGQAALKSLEDHAKALTDTLKASILEGFGPVSASAGIAAAAAVALGLELFKLGQHATEAAAELQKVSLTTGIAVPALADLKFALEATGGSLEQLNTVMFMFEQRMVNSSEKVDTGLKLIGLSLEAIDTMSHDQQILAISAAMQSAGDDTNRAAAAMDIFGRQGRTILPQLMQPLTELAAKSKELGNVTAAAAEAAHEFEIAQKTMVTEASLQWTKLGLTVAPITNEIAYGYERMKLAVANVAMAAVELGTAFGWLTALTEWEMHVEAALPKVASSLKGLADGSGLAAKQLQDYLDQVDRWKGTLPTLDDALENTKEVQRDLDSETQKHIETVQKHQAAVEALVAAFEGESKKTGETIEAIQKVMQTHTDDIEVIQRVVDAIDKLADRGVTITDAMWTWADANRTVKGTIDALHGKLTELSFVIPDNTAHVEAMRAKFEDVRAVLHGTTLDIDLLAGATGSDADVNAAWGKSLDEVNADARKLGFSFGDLDKDLRGLATAFGTLSQISGGTFGGILQDVGKLIGEFALLSKATKQFQESQGDAANGISANYGEMTTSAISMGASAVSTFSAIHNGTIGTAAGIASMTMKGAAIGSVVPVIGTAIGAAIGLFAGVVAHFTAGASAAEKEGRKIEAAFQDQFGTFQQMMDAVGATYAATGRSATQAQADVKALMDAEKLGGQAATDAANKIKEAFTEQTQDATDLNAAVKKYGFSLAELGPTMQKQQLDEQAKTLLNDWRLLAGSGMDVATVNEHMAASVADYLTKAKLTGQEVPMAMKPVLQSMIDQGLLTDANGKAITDMKDLGVTFSETMTQGFDKVVNKLDELLTKLGLVPGKLSQIPTSTNVDVNLNARWNIPPIPKMDGADGAAFGGFVTSHGIAQYLAGGFPGSARGTDTVPAWLTPGEAVLTKSATSALGPKIIQMLNRGSGAVDLSQLATPGGAAAPAPIHTHIYLNDREIARAVTQVQDADFLAQRKVRAA